MKVCEKVQRKGTTSYNEVADELVSEFTNSNSHLATDSVSKYVLCYSNTDLSVVSCNSVSALSCTVHTLLHLTSSQI